MNRRNHTKNRKSATFAEKALKINNLKIKNIVKLEIIAIIQVNTDVLQITYVI